ncbi:MAG TPA: THUMP domain-containing protein, partial [Candidatus Thermoplasmatota archaeon]|nr:THUMP domain-containing protein [Candidatus Thermoplasmatota archaeon]
MNYDIILIRYGELSLKSSYVRKYFESILVRNIKKALTLENISHTIRNERGRIYLITTNISKSITVLPRIFGIVSFSPAVQTTSTMEDMSHYALQLTKNILTKEKSFAIRPTRVGTHQFTSREVAVRIGSDIVGATQARVDLTHPEVELFIEIREKKSFLFTQKIPGVGGLPLGTQGKILAFVEKPSSLLAAWYLMHRGCNVILVTMNQANEEAIRSFLTQWYADAEIINTNTTGDDFYRYLSIIASEKKCDALVTGHTLEEPFHSLSAIMQLKKNSNLPILSPLIALTREEIDQQGKKRGILV